MSKPHDGGPAFPYKQPDRIDRVTGKPLANTERPVTVRDWFAAKALNGLIAACGTNKIDYEGFSIQSYDIADAMMAQRDKEKGSIETEISKAKSVSVTKEGKSHGKK